MEIRYTIPQEDILKQLIRQLESHFLLTDEEKAVVAERFDYALEACEENFKVNENKYFRQTVGGGRICAVQPIPFRAVHDIPLLSVA